MEQAAAGQALGDYFRKAFGGMESEEDLLRLGKLFKKVGKGAKKGLGIARKVTEVAGKIDPRAQKANDILNRIPVEDLWFWNWLNFGRDQAA